MRDESLVSGQQCLPRLYFSGNTERERWQGWNTFRPAKWRAVVLTRGLEEGSVRQTPCNIYQLLSSSSKEEKEERRRGWILSATSKACGRCFQASINVANIVLPSQLRNGAEGWRTEERGQNCGVALSIICQWKPDHSPAFGYLRLRIHNITLKTVWLDVNSKIEIQAESLLLLWKIKICTSDDDGLVGGVRDSICQYGAISIKQVQLVYATTYQSPWWWLPSPNTSLSWVLTGTTKDMCNPDLTHDPQRLWQGHIPTLYSNQKWWRSNIFKTLKQVKLPLFSTQSMYGLDDWDSSSTSVRL